MKCRHSDDLDGLTAADRARIAGLASVPIVGLEGLTVRANLIRSTDPLPKPEGQPKAPWDRGPVKPAPPVKPGPRKGKR